MKIYCCDVDPETPKSTSGETVAEAYAAFDCKHCLEEEEGGRCGGIRVVESDKPGKPGKPDKPEKIREPRKKKRAWLPQTATKINAAASAPEPQNPRSLEILEILGITPGTDAVIVEELKKLAESPIVPTIAPHLAQLYGDDIRLARASNRGWEKILKIFRKQGLHIGRESLKRRVEK
jgi:hypothetical protein